MESEAEPRSKRRSHEEKVGRLKYILQVEKQILRRLDVIELDLRTIKAGFAGSGMLHYTQPQIEKVACKDEVDVEILRPLYQAGGAGMYPKDIAARLSFYKLTRFHILRRLQRMNRRLEEEMKEHVAERRGWHWALTGFAYEIWHETIADKVEKEAGSEASTEL
jgi:hypothetical protein